MNLSRTTDRRQPAEDLFSCVFRWQLACIRSVADPISPSPTERASVLGPPHRPYNRAERARYPIMTRGNQRDLARAKNLKKQSSQGKGKQSDTDANKGLTLEQRKQRDADVMRAKQEAKKKAADDAKAAGGSGSKKK